MDEEKNLLDIIKKLKQTDLISESENLLLSGFLDSFDLISLIDEIEKTFLVRIKGEYITEENFKSVEAIAKLMAKLKQEQEILER